MSQLTFADPVTYMTHVRDHIGGWPRDYMVIDIETQGRSTTSLETMPLEFGWVFSVDGSVIQADSFMINWALLPEVDEMKFGGSIDATQQQMMEKGLPYRFTYRMVRDKGIHPQAAMERVADLYEEAAGMGMAIVGHNHHRFDIPIIEMSMKRLGIEPPDLLPSMVDTMIVEKGRMLDMPPNPGETRIEWCKRVFAKRTTIGKEFVKGYGLADCSYRYKLPATARDDQHTGKGDCLTTAALMEALGALQ